MAVSDGSGLGLLEFLAWAGSRGELAANTASSYASAARRVFTVEPGVDERPLAEVDLENLLDRFETLNRTEYSAASMNTYKSRVRHAAAMYALWLAKDPDWKSGGRSSRQSRTTGPRANGSARAARSKATDASAASTATTPGAAHAALDPPSSVGATRLIGYDMPLRPDLMVRLTLPADLTKADAARVAAFVNSLAFGAEGDAAP